MLLFKKINNQIVQVKKVFEENCPPCSGAEIRSSGIKLSCGAVGGHQFSQIDSRTKSQNRPRGSFAATSRFDEFSRDRPWMQTKTGACLTDTLKSSLLLLNSLTSH